MGSSLDALSDEMIDFGMKCALIGKDYGLDVAERRVKGDFEMELLSWPFVRSRLRRDGD